MYDFPVQRLFVLLFVGCSSAGPPIYDGPSSAALGAPGNQATCHTCHSNDGSRAGFPGNSLKNIAYRKTFKGDATNRLLIAVNACTTEWMGGAALTENDAAWKEIARYLESISDPSVTTPNPMVAEVLDDLPAYEAAYTGGDAGRGAGLYDENCARCHDHALRVATSIALSRDQLKAFPIGRIAQKVRTSGPPQSARKDAMDTTPFPMPFFEVRDLSQESLKDIIAFLKR